MNPDKQFGDASLYLGDCLNIMPHLHSCEHIIADPPYEDEAHTRQRRLQRENLGGGVHRVSKEPLRFDSITADERIESARLMADLSMGWVLAFCQAEAVGSWKYAFEKAGAKWRRAAIWVKPDGQPQLSGDRPGMGYESIACAWAGESGSSWNGGGKHGVYIIPKGETVRWGHQTQKPIALMTKLIADFTQPGDLILDPFMGSGSTGVACIEAGRRFVGIEKDEESFAIAVQRIELATSQLRMFP